ncbi:sigma-70 family RNA polymerase sigma factor [Methylocapsa sp. S129]|uniref:sigma-70 family RNA polymerase sigma factor n=1 Tax=Methylocapsa sp. S129 TaxID=1641869 RepID=UPI00131B4A28|nr:sigma-70 family RNA polymerase sigma factor [Methylocapsa sp. S129]
MADASLKPEAFGRLMAELRPRLHRYCARMVGSAVDGEDVVQEALAKAAEAFPAAGAIERPESWLFRIAHNAALDALRRRKRQAAVRSDIDIGDLADSSAAADARVAAAASLAAFMNLPAAQRSSVVLMDVLGYSLGETVEILNVSLPAVKAALHRARARLKALAGAPERSTPILSAAERERLRAYADEFNARNFDALRDLLAEDVRLDLVNKTRLAGRKDVSVYFSRYAESADWRFAPGLAEGRPALLVSNPADPAGAVGYVVLLDWTDGKIAAIRDFRFAPYAMESLIVARF